MKAFTRFRLLGTVVTLLALPAALCAQEYAYADNGNGTCTITGYGGAGGNVVIPSTLDGLLVASIGCNAFFLCTSLTSVVVPNSVTSIHRYAFWDCTSLTSILIGNGITSIGDDAFSACTSLTDITFTGDAPSICLSTFLDADLATVYYLPGALGWDAPTFGGRPAVMCAPQMPFTYADNGDGTCTITGYIGNGGDVIIPATLDGLTVTRIGDEAFYAGNSLTTVTISDSVSAIGRWAFWHCGRLGRVTIGTGVASMGTEAFGDCAVLAQVFFRGNAPAFEPDVFAGDHAVHVYGLAGTTNWNALPGGLPLVTYATNNGAATITGCTCACGVAVIDATLDGLPVTCIGSQAFCGCACLTSITIPASVTSIGDAAFASCPNLTGVSFQGNAPALGAGVFTGDDQASVTFLLGTTGWGASFGDLPTIVEGWTFADNGNGTCTITGYTDEGGDVCIPGLIDGLSVTRIGDGAFSTCQGLTRVTFPASVAAVGSDPFGGCVNLAAMTVDTDNAVYSSADGILFDKVQTALIRYPAGRTGSYAIPVGVTSIGDGAFSGCGGLTSLSIPATVTRIGREPFGDCAALGLITVDAANPVYSSVDGVLFDKGETTLIQYPAAREGIYAIPANVTRIGNCAFSACYSLASVAIPASVTTIGDNAFADCESLSSVAMPASVTRIGDNAFLDCYSLTRVTIPASVTNMGDEAFGSCVNLASVYFKGNAPVPAGPNVFGDAGNATIYFQPGTTGWDTSFGALPTALWNPQVLRDSSFGAVMNQFGFTITNVGNPDVVVEACTSLTGGVWSPVATNTLTGGSCHFGDPDTANYPARFYRFRMP